MKSCDLAPIVLDYCVQFLDERPIGTRYHPKKGLYIVDAHMIARIIRHQGNMRAQVTREESLFCNRIMKELVNLNIVSAPISRATYECTEDYTFNRFDVKVKRIKHLKIFKGRKPKILEDKENVGTMEINNASATAQ